MVCAFFAQHAARARRGRGLGVRGAARDEVQHLDRADLARTDALVHATVVDVEAAVEAHGREGAGPPGRIEAVARALEARGDRLLAQDRLAGGDAGEHVRLVRIRRRADGDDAHPRVREHRRQRRREARAVLGGQRLAARSVDVHDPAQLGIAVRGEVARVDASDDPRTDHAEADGGVAPVPR